jgi:glutathione synthase/RimK-type ligase-like ATP-grasp enzyme
LPDEINEFEEHIKENEDATYIAKPSNGKAGRGIRLLKSFQELPKSAYEHEYLLQRYIENPLLVNGKKFDARLFVLIYGIDPIQAYLCDEGLARFCTTNYQKPNQ